MSAPKNAMFFTNSPDVHAWRFCEKPCTSRNGTPASGCSKATFLGL
ncbi:MAG: hypothetical protein IPK07_27795 [Deltaproteobacteria bacterium]|nr:hypothetical protein [Deltaproteobacteria bacterium]